MLIPIFVGVKLLNLILFSSLYLSSLTAWTQTKVEREFRLKESEIPKAALDFTNKLTFEAKERWYREESENSHSIELKSKLFDRDISIEFDTLGRLEDVEIKLGATELDKLVLARIDSILVAKHDRHKILKIQYQLSDSEEVVLKYLAKEPDLVKTPHQLELVLRTSTRGAYEKWGYLFTQEGSLVSRIKFQLKNTDILDY